MKRFHSAALLAAMVLWIAACGGNSNGTDETTAGDAADTVTTDIIDDSGDDVRPDATDDSALEDAAQDAVQPDADEDTAGDIGPGDVTLPDSETIEPLCEGAVALAANTPYLADGLDSSVASVWQDYSCDAEWSYTGPERLFSYTPACTGQVKLTVTPEGNPMTDSYLMVAVALLSSCDPSDCIDVLPPAHPIQLTAQINAGEPVIMAVEAIDTALPAFTVLIEQFCLACDDNDSDGFDGYNEIYCPDGTDCNDDDTDVNTGMSETTCDGIDQDCSGTDSCNSIVCVDNDVDGYFNFDAAACPVGLDCNDSNGSISPAAAEVNCNGADEDCDGLDWCPGTGQQCDSCLLTGTCRNDHVCMPGLGGALGIYAYCAALCDNANQCPDGSTCVADVYEGHGVCMAGTGADCSAGFLTVSDTCGNPVYSAQCPGDCDEPAGVCVEQCAGSTPASLDTTISGRLTAGQSAMSSYPGFHEVAGHEEVYSFTAPCTGTGHALATEMADLELVLFALAGQCANTLVVASDTEDGMVHEVEFAVVEGDSYFVAVDTTIQDQAGPFTLMIEIDCGVTGRGHCEACQFDLQCASGYCNVPGEPPVPEGSCVADCSTTGSCPEGSACLVAGEHFVCMPRLTGACEGQVLSATDSCGVNFVMETCAGDTDCNATLLSCTDDCIDNDGDGYSAFGAETCPNGTDCDDVRDDIHPGADDVRCNEIDEDCSGADNCSDNGQCEQCEGGHCAPGYYCFVDPNFDVPGICLADCTDTMECPTGETWDLACNSWMSGLGDDSYYCRPEVTRSCSVGGDELVTDGCGRTVQTNECDLSCFNNFGCVNYCTAATDHPGCGLTVSGTTAGGADRTDYYYNADDTVDDLTGPEAAYKFTASCTGEMAVVLKNAADWLTLVVLRNSSGVCMSNKLVAYDIFLDTPEVVSFAAIEGEEFTLIVDGMDGAAGEFALTVNCLCGTGCIDADHDGFIDLEMTYCPSGNDCDGTHPAVHPGATETECNDIDEDCSGYDACASHACTADVELGNLLEPVVNLAGSTTGSADEMTFYAGACESPYPRFNVETVYHFQPTCSGTFSATLSDAYSDQIDMYLLADACRADLCTTTSWVEMNTEVVADRDYYLVVDGNAATSNTWTLDASVTCL